MPLSPFSFIPADKALLLTSTTTNKEERCKIIANSFAAAFGIEEARQPIHYEEGEWNSDQYIGGGYYMMPQLGFLTRFGPYLRQPVGRLYFAGTECAFNWSGYMNGAVQAGERAARQLLVALGRLPSSQVDEPEPVSLEYPPAGPFELSIFERYAPSGRAFLNGLTISSLTVVGAVSVGAFLYYRRI